MSDRFQPMLAERKTPRFSDPRFLGHAPWWASFKLDGIRSTNYIGQMLSRTLLPIRSRFVQDTFAGRLYHGLDGELICGDAGDANVFQRTTSAVMTIGATTPVHYYVFDDWSNPTWPYRTRLEYLRARVRQIGNPHLVVLDQVLLHEVDELELLSTRALELGYEGLILRAYNGEYKFGRSTLNEGHLLKVKPTEDSEARVIGFEEKLHNENEATVDARGYTKRSRHAEGKTGSGTLGALLVEDVHFGWTFRIGVFKNLDDAAKQAIWDNRERYLDAICVYTFQRAGMVDVPRIPRWKAWRHVEDVAVDRVSVQTDGLELF